MIASRVVTLTLGRAKIIPEPLPLALNPEGLSSPPSQIISPTPASGYVYVVDELSTIQHRVFERPTVVIAKHVSGAEEIPLGATAVLSGSSVDVLSHSAVRARNSKVFFATCYDAEVTQSLMALDGQVRISSSGSPYQRSLSSPRGMHTRNSHDRHFTHLALLLLQCGP